jgi:hypothetical protein
LDTERVKQNTPTSSRSIDENEKLMKDIQIYEKRIQGLIDGIEMLKDRVNR